MNKLPRLILPSLLLALVVLALIVPARGQSTTRLAIEQGGVEKETIAVPVCSRFTVEIWVRDIPYPPYYLVGFNFEVKWDPTMMEFISNTPNSHGWEYNTLLNEEAGLLAFETGYPIPMTYIPWPGINEDDRWLTITFHCLREGTSTISVTSPGAGTVWVSTDGRTALPDTEVEGFETTVHQFKAVGGVLVPVNTFGVLAPYLALMGLVGAVTAAAILRRKRND